MLIKYVPSHLSSKEGRDNVNSVVSSLVHMIKIDRVIKFLAMLVNQWQFVFIPNSSIMLIHSFWDFLTCFSNVYIIAILTA